MFSGLGALTVSAGCGNIEGVENSIEVRRARAEDKSAVVAFCQNTFSWGDYIPEVYDSWVRDENGRLFVATAENQPVALLHVAAAENGVAWMEGMRVHPEFRRHGVGSVIDTAGRDFAHARGWRVARLATNIKNTTAQSLLGQLGYARIAQFGEWQAEPDANGTVHWRIAAEKDADEILTRWQNSEIRIAAHDILPTPHWSWLELTPARLDEQIAKGQVRVSSDGFAFLRAEDSEDYSGIEVQALVGDTEALAREVRAEAAYRGYPKIGCIMPDDARANAGLERAGFNREGAMLIYEQPL